MNENKIDFGGVLRGEARKDQKRVVNRRMVVSFDVTNNTRICVNICK